MAANLARAPAQKKAAAFVDDVRRLRKQAGLVFQKSLIGGKRARLYVLLDELEETAKELKLTAVSASSTTGSARIPTAGLAPGRSARAPVPLVLDSTEAMIAKGQLVTPVEFQRLMGWSTRQALWKAADSHRVFYLTHKAERYFPTFYADPSYERKHLEAVTKLLGDLPGGSKLQFFLTRKGSLSGETPLQALAAGRFAKVKDVAAAFAEVPVGA